MNKHRLHINIMGFFPFFFLVRKFSKFFFLNYYLKLKKINKYLEERAGFKKIRTEMDNIIYTIFFQGQISQYFLLLSQIRI